MSEVEITHDNTQWLTPDDILTGVDVVLGGIDLDPCAHSIKTDHVPAMSFFTQEDDGLSREWYGTVFMNPPYCRGSIDQFAMKFLHELSCGRMTMGIALVNADPSTKWFRKLAMASDIVGFFSPRVKFVRPVSMIQAVGSQQRPQAILGFNVSSDLFRKQFRDRCWFTQAFEDVG